MLRRNLSPGKLCNFLLRVLKMFCAIIFFISFQCVPNKGLPKKSKQQPLKMILSKTAGARFLMDLVTMPVYNNHNYILRVMDHLSKFGYIAAIKQRTAKEVGDALLRILSSSIMPKILQLDNGGEVCSTFFLTFHYVFHNHYHLLSTCLSLCI